MSDAFPVAAGEIGTPRLRLRKLMLDDARDVFAYANDPEVARFTLWPPHHTLEFSIGFVGVLMQPVFLSWAILRRDSGRFLGTAFLHNFNKYHQRVEIGYNLARFAWNEGYGTETARAVVRFAFEVLGVHRVEATCMPENERSRRVLEKLGMSREGTMRESHHSEAGFHDMDLYALLREDPASPPRLTRTA